MYTTEKRLYLWDCLYNKIDFIVETIEIQQLKSRSSKDCTLFSSSINSFSISITTLCLYYAPLTCPYNLSIYLRSIYRYVTLNHVVLFLPLNKGCNLVLARLACKDYETQLDGTLYSSLFITITATGNGTWSNTHTLSQTRGAGHICIHFSITFPL